MSWWLDVWKWHVDEPVSKRKVSAAAVPLVADHRAVVSKAVTSVFTPVDGGMSSLLGRRDGPNTCAPAVQLGAQRGAGSACAGECGHRARAGSERTGPSAR